MKGIPIPIPIPEKSKLRTRTKVNWNIKLDYGLLHQETPNQGRTRLKSRNFFPPILGTPPASEFCARMAGKKTIAAGRLHLHANFGQIKNQSTNFKISFN